ncbi:MAG: zinc ribbon domain-containing protein [Chloroflexi bacterium]|nr:zinc ribbon domain-containing protein [Chloroflexota bacterium]
MPLFEYRCQDCGERFEKLMPLAAEPAPIHCPRCGGESVKRSISLFGRIASGRSDLWCPPGKG